jgi:hypothetical protein
MNWNRGSDCFSACSRVHKPLPTPTPRPPWAVGVSTRQPDLSCRKGVRPRGSGPIKGGLFPAAPSNSSYDREDCRAERCRPPAIGARGGCWPRRRSLSPLGAFHWVTKVTRRTARMTLKLSPQFVGRRSSYSSSASGGIVSPSLRHRAGPLHLAAAVSLPQAPARPLLLPFAVRARWPMHYRNASVGGCQSPSEGCPDPGSHIAGSLLLRQRRHDSDRHEGGNEQGTAHHRSPLMRLGVAYRPGRGMKT